MGDDEQVRSHEGAEPHRVRDGMGPDPGDEELLRAIQGGDGESFGLLYDRTRRFLLSCIIRPRVGPADAEDVLAETYHTAFTEVGSFEWRGISLLHWLSAIARRKSQERVRKALRRDAREPAFPDLAALFDAPDSASTKEAEMIREETLRSLKKRVAGTLESLHPRYAEVLRLRLLESLPRVDCASRLGVTPATFDVLLYRATRAFAKRWREA